MVDETEKFSNTVRVYHVIFGVVYAGDIGLPHLHKVVRCLGSSNL